MEAAHLDHVAEGKPKLFGKLLVDAVHARARVEKRVHALAGQVRRLARRRARLQSDIDPHGRAYFRQEVGGR
jgi:hypothetical protein